MAYRKQQRCPRCGAALSLHRDGDVVLRTCGECGGLWIDHELLSRIVDKSPTEIATALSRLSTTGGDSFDTSKSDIPCPECSGPMKRKRFFPGNVTIDVCSKEHGFWFDANELQSVARAATHHHRTKARTESRDGEQDRPMLPPRPITSVERIGKAEDDAGIGATAAGATVGLLLKVLLGGDD
jgi:Zn-finger nucleic acid-binding protein